MNHILNNRTYDLLKQLTQVVLPGLGTLYFALSEIWAFPYGPEVVGTITAIVTFLGVALGFSTKNYRESDDRIDGYLDVVETDQTKSFQLEFDGDPYDLDSKDELVFKVRPGS